MRLVSAFFACVMMFSGSLALAQQQPTEQAKQIRVATRLVPPFVFKDGEQLTGFSTDLMSALGRELNVTYQTTVKTSVPELLDEVKSGQADLAIAAISITSEREKIFDFSQPMFDSGLQILVPAKGQNASVLPAMASLLSSKGFIELALIMLLLSVLPVPLIFLLERGHPEPIFKGKTLLGSLGKTLWWSASTVVGQATHMPSSLIGRMVAVIWMLLGVVFISYFTANVTANLTVKQLESSIASPADLKGKRVAVIKGSTGAAAAKANGAEVVEFTQIPEAFAALKGGDIVAMVHDAPILQYYAAHDGNGEVQVAGEIFKPESYGILMPLGSPMRRDIDAALLKLRETGEYTALYKKWFSASAN